MFVISSLVIYLSSCSKADNVNSDQQLTSLFIVQNIDYKYNEFSSASVFLEFDDILTSVDNKQVKRLKLPQRNRPYHLKLFTKPDKVYKYNWLVSGGAQVHSFSDSLAVSSVEERLVGKRRIQPLTIAYYMPQITGFNSVRHILHIDNNNTSPVKPHFTRILYSKSGRLLNRKNLSENQLLPAGETSKIEIDDFLPADLLSETVTVIIDSVEHLIN